MKFAIARTLVAAVLAVTLFGSQAMAQNTIFGAPTLKLMGSMPSSARISVHGGDGGAPVGFAVEWMKRSELDALGGLWPTPGTVNWHGEFTGTPTWVVQGNAGDFSLTAAEWQCVQVGELFDETGLWATNTGELE